MTVGTIPARAARNALDTAADRSTWKPTTLEGRRNLHGSGPAAHAAKA
jgi:hypothetical protein